MAEYEEGTVAVATVRGVEGVRVMPRMAGGGVPDGWVSSQRIGSNIIHYGDDVTDVRPLVVLDLERFVTWELLTTWLRQNSVCGSYRVASEIADQIEAQTKPPRIPEPGLYGVVSTEDANGLTTHHWRSHDGWHSEDGGVFEWDNLVDPVLVREGVDG